MVCDFKKKGLETKHVLISDCTVINSFESTQEFNLEQLANICSNLRQDMFACKMDTSMHIFTYLGKGAKKYMKMKVGKIFNSKQNLLD